MLKKALLLCVALTILLSVSACSTTVPSDTDWESENRYQNWISPAKIDVINYYAGKSVEGVIRVHNGNEYTTERYRVTTDPGETIVDLKVKQPIVGNSIDNIKITSDNANDKFEVISCDYKTVVISGFAQNETRILEITYRYLSKFQITYEPAPYKDGYLATPVNADSWVTISETTPYLEPYETRDIPITLAMPKEAEPIEGRWRFRIVAYDASQSGMIQTQYASIWIVAMR